MITSLKDVEHASFREIEKTETLAICSFIQFYFQCFNDFFPGIWVQIIDVVLSNMLVNISIEFKDIRYEFLLTLCHHVNVNFMSFCFFYNFWQSGLIWSCILICIFIPLVEYAIYTMALLNSRTLGYIINAFCLGSIKRMVHEASI